MKRAFPLVLGLLALILAGMLSAAVLMSRVGSQTAASVPAAIVSYENLQGVGVLVPDDDPAGLVFLLSDRGGLSAADRDLAADLVDSGLIVMPIDLDRWIGAMEDASEADADCLYLGSDIEGIAKEALRALKLDTYFHPVVVGRGEGGTLAYAAVADAPDATVAGGVAIGALSAAHSKLPVCEGAKATPARAGAFSYDRQAELPSPFTFVEAGGDPRPTPMKAPMQAGAVVERDADARDDAVATAAAAIADADNSALPIVVGKPAGEPTGVVVFFSGDGGWRDLDKTIGDWLTAQGVEVIGVDSLRYFWSEKTPEQMADDIATMLVNVKPGPGVPIALLGYSFGADTLPFAFSHLPKEWSDRVSLIGLLAPSMETGFQISVGGWLGLSTGDRGVVAAAEALPAAKVLCVYGKDEDDSACLDPKLTSLTRLPIEGGHHFDGEYDALAARLLAAMRAGPPAALTPPAP